MIRDVLHAELLCEFVHVMEEVGPSIALNYKWNFIKLRENECVLRAPYCDMHFLLYFGHDTNIVVMLKPKRRIARKFGYEQIGIYYTLAEEQAKKCMHHISTRQDIETSIRNHVGAINESCVRLMNGDLEEWMRYKARVDRAVADGMKEYNARLDKAKQAARRIYGTCSD